MILLPLTAFLLMWVFFYRSAPRDRGVRISFLTTSLLWGALVAFSTETLSLFNALNRSSIAVFWITAAAAAAFALTKTPDPDLTGAKTKHTTKIDDALNFSTIAIIVLVGLTAFVAPPNNWDSMTYHMSRVAHWIQNRSVEFFPTSMPRQLWASPWAEYAIAQLQILSQSDRWANMIQWWSMAASVIGVSLIAQALGASRRGQILSSLIAATLPVGILEASSTQNDYAAALWIVCFVIFGIKLLKEFQIQTAVFWTVALGLAVLTKATAITFSAAFTIWILTAGFKKYGRTFFPALALLIAVPLLINAPQFIRNHRLSGNILSLASESKSVSNQDHTLEGTVSNAIRYVGLNLAVDQRRINKNIEASIRWAHDRLRWNVADPRYTLADEYRIIFSRHEDSSCNTVTALILLASVILFLLHRNWNPHLFPYFLSLITAFILFCLALKWQPWGNRLLLPIAVLSAPFIGTVLDKKRPAIGAAVAVLLIVICIPWIFQNTSRAMISKQYSIFTKDRNEQYFTNLPGMYFSYKRAAEEIRASGCHDIGLAMTTESWEYPLWPLLGAMNDRALRIEHINVPNPSNQFNYPRGPFDPCAVIGDGAMIEQPSLTVNGATYVNTNRWAHLSLFRKDSDGKMSVMVRNARFTSMLDYSLNADKLMVQAQKDGLTSEIATQVFMLRKEALAQAKLLDTDELNRIYPDLGTSLKNLFIFGNEQFLNGISDGNTDAISRGQGLLNDWNVWFQKNLSNLQKIFQ